MNQMTTNDMFTALVRDLPRLTAQADGDHYTELAIRVSAEGDTLIMPDIMHAILLQAHNTQQQTK